jgi:glycosyltransferase involved in cell wall biosynthesis
MHTPLVSVIIPNYNYEHYLAECIQSVLDQTYPHLECIVVDDGSTDGSAALVTRLAEKDQRLKLVRKSNGGLSSARNEGLRQAVGEYISFLDSDDKWENGKIEHQLEVFKNTACDVVFSNFSYWYEHGIKRSTAAPPRITIYELIRENCIAGSASSVMITREVFEKTGFFDTNLRSAEDLDYWTRIAFHNFRFEFCPHYDVYLRQHGSSMSRNGNKMIHFHLLSLDKQLGLLDEVSGKIDKEAFTEAIYFRLGEIRKFSMYYQYPVWGIHSFLLGMNLIGVRYLFMRGNFKRFAYDIYRFIKAKKQYP